MPAVAPVIGRFEATEGALSPRDAIIRVYGKAMLQSLRELDIEDQQSVERSESALLGGPQERFAVPDTAVLLGDD